MASPFAHDNLEKLGDYHDRNDYETPEHVPWKFRRLTGVRELLEFNGKLWRLPFELKKK